MTPRRLARVSGSRGWIPEPRVVFTASPSKAQRFAIPAAPRSYRDAVRENQPAVCTLHRGITRGLLDKLDPDARLVGFVARDPFTAGCLIDVQGAAARWTAQAAR
jgi:hypothetical protein